ncbi:hypothetical protein G9A89_002256 [Geosiphon pyriformis]|nr:hypothetical protein G9A89_002256 [Geosiphon pyriformis]
MFDVLNIMQSLSTLSKSVSSQLLTHSHLNPLISDLIQDISTLYISSDDYNVVLKIGQEPNVQNFEAHSVILRARSAYFQTALQEPWVKKEMAGDREKIVFEKPNMKPSVFQVILKFMYTGTIWLDATSDHISLLRAADELMLTRLVMHIQEHIINQEDGPWLDNALTQLYQLSSDNLGMQVLKKYCEDRIASEPERFAKTNEFLRLEEKSLITLLNRDDFAMDEIQIWDNVIQWAIARAVPTLPNDIAEWTIPHIQTLEKIIKPIIPYIRFFQISSADYFYRIRPFKKCLPLDLRNQLKAFYLVQGSKPPANSLPSRNPIHTIDSLVITPKQSAFIANWIKGHNGMPKPFAPHSFLFNLLLRGSVDGFDMFEFHMRCDLKGPTVTVIKCKGGRVIGGYNPLAWESSGFYKTTRDSFIFSFGYEIGHETKEGKDPEKHKIILSRVKKERYAIKDFNGSIGGENVGFGNGDLPLFAYSCREKAYERPILDGSHFEVEEYEVFAIENLG